MAHFKADRQIRAGSRRDGVLDQRKVVVLEPRLIEAVVHAEQQPEVAALAELVELHHPCRQIGQLPLDGLVELIGGPPTPGFGFGSGLERVTLVSGLEEQDDEGPLAYVVTFTEEARADAFALTQHLRRELLIDAECDLVARSAKAQLKQAGRSGAELAVLVGLADVAAGEVRVRDLESGAEEDVAVDELGDWFDDWLDDDGLDGHGHHHGNGNGNPLGGNGGGEAS